MCWPASISGPLRIFWLSNGTLSPSEVTWLLPSGTKRPVLPARTRAHAGVPSTSSLNTCSTVPTTLPSAPVTRRSEEHTSELQSRENLVCRLLLEKKKKTYFFFFFF